MIVAGNFPQSSKELKMNAYTQSAMEARALRSSRQQTAELLDRYPDISEAERAEIVSFMRTGRHIDIGLLTSNDALRPKIDAFMADHKKEMRLGSSEIVTVVAAVVAFLALCWLVWEAIAPVTG
jgi:hypothetical protein